MALALIDGLWDLHISQGARTQDPYVHGRLEGSRTPVMVKGYDSLDTIFRILQERKYLDVSFVQIEDGFQMNIVDRHSRKHGYWSRDMKTAIYKAVLVAEDRLPIDDEGER